MTTEEGHHSTPRPEHYTNITTSSGSAIQSNNIIRPLRKYTPEARECKQQHPRKWMSKTIEMVLSEASPVKSRGARTRSPLHKVN